MAGLLKLEWIKEHVAYDGDGCLFWPFGKDDKGYGMVSVGTRVARKSHRVMCQMVNGDPPTPSHHAAHECGNGHLGCVHPKHLKWKTPEENQQDTVLHGTTRKKGTPRQKLSDAQVAEIRAARGQKSRADLSAEYGVRTETIDRIWAGKARTGKPWRSNRHIASNVRPGLVSRAKEMRAAGRTYEHIASTLGIARLTARTMVYE